MKTYVRDLQDRQARAVQQAERRSRAIAAKLCVACCRRPVVDGYTKCAACRGSDTPRVAPPGPQMRADRFCVECAMHGGHRNDCPTR